MSWPVSLWIYLIWNLWNFLICMSVSFPMIGKFSIIISLNKLSTPLSLSSPFGILIMCMLYLLFHQIRGSQSMVPGPVISTSLGKSFKTQLSGLIPTQIHLFWNSGMEDNVCLIKISRWLFCMPRFENLFTKAKKDRQDIWKEWYRGKESTTARNI